MSDFEILEEDKEYLDANFPGWRTCLEGGSNKRGIIISNYLLPDRYNPEKSDLMIIIPTDYPMGKIDMFYFFPALTRKNGSAIDAVEQGTFFGKSWQRWSRHYEWQPGVHSIVSHVSYIQNQLIYD